MAECIIKKKYQDLVDQSHLNRVIDIMFLEMEIQPIPNLSILITDNKEIRSLNKQYRNIDQPTDVLSFDNAYTELDTGQRYLGDIAISFPYALMQAKNEGHSITQELELLIVHGCLHLLGFDHDTKETKQMMWEKQQKILDRLKNPIIV